MPKTIDEGRLFAAAVEVYAARGYDAATTKDIARHAGINEATLFRRYGSKPDLIVAALRHVLDRSPFGSLSASHDVEGDIAAIVQAYQETFRAFGGAVATLLADLPRHPELADATTTLAHNLRSATAILEAHQRAGRLAPGDPGQILVALIAPIAMHGHGSRLMALGNGAEFDTARHVTGFLNGYVR